MSRIFDTGVPVTETQRRFFASSGRRFLMAVLLVLLLLGFLVSLLGLFGLWQASRTYSVEYSDIDRHFRFGSIGSEQSSGIPVKLLRGLPLAFPEHFGDQRDYSRFGFLYDPDAPDPSAARRLRQGQAFGP